MKKIIYITALLLICMMQACTNWLDVNDNPSSVGNKVPSSALRLRSIEMQFIDAYESSGTRASWITQNITKTRGSAYNDYIIKWDPDINSATWPYQAWFVYCASNLQPLIDKATEEESWHYVGAAQLIHAWGFMLMLDMFGEMPYTEALGPSIMPKYDSGSTIFYGCMEMLDKAIDNLSKEQPNTATSLSEGDFWNGGDTQKWIKLAYGLKARWLNNLSKKSFYDTQAILDALEKAPQAVADNTVTRFINSDQTDRAGVIVSLQFSNASSTSNRLTKWYTDLLTNDFTGGSQVLDPRASRIIPSAEFHTPTGKTWMMSKGVDIINTDIRVNGSGPASFEIKATIPDATANMGFKPADKEEQKLDPKFSNRWHTTNTNKDRYGDSIYISIYSDRLDWIMSNGFLDPDAKDDRYYASRYNGMRWKNPSFNPETNIDINSTGSFYIRGDAPAHMLCYHEMCFIKAEVLFRLNRKGEALQAYKAGIRAHMEAMNETLRGYPQVLGKKVISAEEIDTFLSSAAVAQNEGELTMAKIMQQKQIAMSMTLQNWTDMRRFDYSTPGEFGVVYPDFGRPYEFDATAQQCYPTSNPADLRYWPRRFQQCSHEVNYNSQNWIDSNPEANQRTIVSYPVWWDVPGNE